jgi:hypothetical protein
VKINDKILLTSGEQAVILKISSGNYFIATNNGKLFWITPDKIKGESK